MTRREKKLSVIVGIAGGLFGLYLVAFSGFITPMGEFRRQHDAKRLQLLQLQNEEFAARMVQADMVRHAGMSFGTDELEVRDRLRAHLARLVARAGLTLESLTPMGTGGSANRGYREVGWTCNVNGTMQQVLDFLYLIDVQPVLHRIDHVTLTPVRDSNRVTLSLRYQTLLLDVPGATGIEEDTADHAGDLDGEQRRRYDLVAHRDVFRPYIQRVVAVAPQPQPQQPSTEPQQPQPQPAQVTPEHSQKIVSLAQWSGEPKVDIQNIHTREVQTYSIGDRLLGGQIVLVDYRPLPHPENPQLMSPSRVIVRVGREFWAVETEQLLASKRRLRRSELPEELRDPIAEAPRDAAPAVN